MSGKQAGGGGLRSTSRTFEIIELLSAETTAGVTEIAQETGMAKSTVHAHLSTLRDRGYVIRTGDGYQLGMEFLHLGESARGRDPGYALAGEKVEKLAEETDERSQFIVAENGRGIYVHRETGSDAVFTDSAIGGHIPLHATAAGKALLSHYDDETVLDVLDGRLTAPTDNAITDERTLLDELERVRERGYAVNRSENTKGLRALGAPVERPDGSLLGSISVSGPTQRMKGERFEEELPSLLLGTVNELELNIAYSTSP